MKSEIKVPEGWAFIKQSKVANFYNGRAYKLAEWEKTGTPVIRLQNLTGTGKDYYYSNLQLPESQYVKDGDLLYMWSASFGPYIWKGPKAIYHYHIWKVECSDDINKKFMYYHLANITQLLKRKMHGMAILHITKSRMEKEKILLPPLKEQQKIADILSKIDEQIDFTEKIIDKTEELKKGLMQKLLTKGVRHTEFKETELGEIPKEWDIVKLGDCVEQRKETILPSGKGETTYVGLEHIDSGVSWLSRCGTDFSIKSLKYKFSKNSILYGKLRPYLDKAVLTTKEGICSTDIIVIQSKETSLNEFILPILHSRRFLDYANSTTKGSNLPRTSWKSISKFIIPFPSLDEQKQIASILSKVDEQIQDNKKELKHLQELKKGLMQDLLTGKVRATT